MMKKLLAALVCSSCLFMADSASADEKWTYWTWPIGHFTQMEFDRRYYEDGKIPHNRQWDKEQWTPSAWLSQDIELIKEFYRHHVLKDQKVKGGVPYLYVGWQFHNLSGYDKRRVVQTIDHVYGITSIEDDAVFYLYDPRENDVIGMYSKYGLQLQ
tara:strand:+ start:84 stop:551 length:468 start_codon:yes stop_codon:yes gene_type:complete